MPVRPASLARVGMWVACAAVLWAAAVMTPTAAGSTSIEGFTSTSSDTQAGGAPDLSTTFSVAAGSTAETLKTATYDAPAGLYLVPLAVPSCTQSAFELDECASAAQVGLITVRGSNEGSSEALLGTAPVYWLEHTGEFGRLGFVVPTIDATATASLSLREAGDYGLRIDLEGLPATSKLSQIQLTLWGFPASSQHDEERFPRGSPGNPPGCPGLEGTSCIGAPTPSNVLVRPFTDNPSICGVPLKASLSVRTYEDPEASTRADTGFHSTAGCSQTTFQPSLDAAVTTSFGYSRSGLALLLGSKQVLGLTPSPSELRSAQVWLPPEFELHPRSPAGLTTCSDSQAALGIEAPTECPAASEVGTASVELIGIDAPLQGKVFLGVPRPGELARLLVIVSGGGVELKLAAQIGIDPETEQLRIEFPAQPQLPIASVLTHLYGGEKGLFRTPIYCGSYPIEAVPTPWNTELGAQELQTNLAITAGPNGAPCVTPGRVLSVALSPDVLIASGSSQATLRIGVTDANGTPIAGDDIAVSSSDPGQRIGPVLDNEDGTYSAVLTSSISPGTSNITVIDRSASPIASAVAPLLQTGHLVQTEAALPSTPRPLVKLLHKPPRRTTTHRPRFVFVSDLRGTRYECKADRGHYRGCVSPWRPKLALGEHTVYVRGVASGGPGPATTWHFRIVKPRHRRKVAS